MNAPRRVCFRFCARIRLSIVGFAKRSTLGDPTRSGTSIRTADSAPGSAQSSHAFEVRLSAPFRAVPSTSLGHAGATSPKRDPAHRSSTTSQPARIACASLHGEHAERNDPSSVMRMQWRARTHSAMCARCATSRTSVCTTGGLPEERPPACTTVKRCSLEEQHHAERALVRRRFRAVVRLRLRVRVLGDPAK
jgi:hypothetical protein